MEEVKETRSGFIYKISSPQTDKVYIGSTTYSIKDRLSKHKNQYKRYQNVKDHYVSSFEIVKYDDVKIELIEEIEYVNKKQLFEREKYFMETIQNVVNKHRPIATKQEKKEQKKEYSVQNKDKIKEAHKQYYKKNKDILNEKYKCECGGSYSRAHHSSHNKTKRHVNYKTNHITLNITINDGGVANITTTKDN